MAEWWVFAHGREMGPVSAEQLIQLARTHGVAGISVWRKGFDDWQLLGEVAELRTRADLLSDRSIASVAHPPSRRSWKRWSIAVSLIGITIGLALYALHSGAWKQAAELLKSQGVPVAATEPKQIVPPAADARPSRDAIASSIVASAPTFATLKEKFPEQFDSMIDDYADGGSGEAEALEKARGKLATFVLSQMRQADDDVLVDYNRLLVDQMSAFKEKNPTYCYQYASGSEFSPAIFRELPAQIQLRDQQLQNRVLQTARQRDAARPDDIQRILEGVGKQLQASQTNMDILNLARVDRERHGEYCEATIRFFSEIGKLPDPDMAVAMRFILGAKR
jgi:hypothetical protein